MVRKGLLYAYERSVMKSRDSGLVYSTEQGKVCPLCRRPKRGCICRLPEAVPKGDGFVRVRRETKGRRGKAVTVVMGIPLGASDLNAFAKELKKKLSSGGSVKDGQLELQGDHRDRVVKALEERGWKVKLAGG